MKRCLRAKILGTIVVSIVVASCQKPPNRDDPSRQANAAAIQLQPADLAKATSVEINDDWNGYSDITPVIRRYKLTRQGDGFVGNAHVAIGGYGTNAVRQQRTTKVQLDRATVERVWQELATLQLKPGVYQPRIVRRDDYPSVAIKIIAPDRQYTFSSRSQSANYVPWEITVSEGSPGKPSKSTTKYITDLPGADRALKLVLDRIGDRHLAKLIDSRRHPQPSATQAGGTPARLHRQPASDRVLTGRSP
jgi:hypothetical protein